MKKQIIPGCVIMLLALVIAAGSVSFLQPCVHEDGTVGACYWAGRSLLGLGLLVLVLSLLHADARHADQPVQNKQYALPGCDAAGHDDSFCRCRAGRFMRSHGMCAERERKSVNPV